MDLLPVAAGVHLQSALKLDKVRALLSGPRPREVAINLSQNPLCQEHFGDTAPVVLASTTTVWGVLAGRPYTAKATWPWDRGCFKFKVVQLLLHAESSKLETRDNIDNKTLSRCR